MKLEKLRLYSAATNQTTEDAGSESAQMQHRLFFQPDNIHFSFTNLCCGQDPVGTILGSKTGRCAGIHFSLWRTGPS